MVKPHITNEAKREARKNYSSDEGTIQSTCICIRYAAAGCSRTNKIESKLKSNPTTRKLSSTDHAAVVTRDLIRCFSQSSKAADWKANSKEKSGTWHCHFIQKKIGQFINLNSYIHIIIYTSHFSRHFSKKTNDEIFSFMYRCNNQF